MNFFRQFLHRPQRLWVRQLNFQVHLWVGIILSLYMIVIMSVLFIRWMQQQERQQREEESRWEAIHRDTPPAWQK